MQKVGLSILSEVTKLKLEHLQYIKSSNEGGGLRRPYSAAAAPHRPAPHRPALLSLEYRGET